jgi:myo-inositol-1(or 4)-monophosphatase
MIDMQAPDASKKLIEETAREAGALLRGRFHERHDIQYKGEINIVTEADRLSERLIVEKISRVFPEHGILTEESPEKTNRSAFRWIVDPLDGTTNYAHGYPVFSVSIALEVAGMIVLGVVYNPMLEEFYLAEKGKGSYLNGRRLAVSREGILSRSLLATGFPYDLRTNSNNNINYFRAFSFSAQAIRRAGSAAFDLACLAAGRFDGFWELKLAPWDTAAGWLLVEEAGGMVTDLTGGPYDLHSPNILATNGFIHQEMITIVAGTDPLDRT